MEETVRWVGWMLFAMFLVMVCVLIASRARALAAAQAGLLIPPIYSPRRLIHEIPSYRLLGCWPRPARRVGLPALRPRAGRLQGRIQDVARCCRRPSPGARAARSGPTWCKERTSGRINIKLYPGVSLIQGDQTREFSAMRQGVIDVLCGAPINWSPQVQQLNLFSLPFLMPDHTAWRCGDRRARLVKDDYFETVRQGGRRAARRSARTATGRSPTRSGRCSSPTT